MSVVFDRPYQFVPPHTGRWWPNLIQATRLYDYFLRRDEGVVDHEVQGLENFASAVSAGHGILLTPNHCRYADPLVLGWPARRLKTHLYAIASWHLFNQSRWNTFAIRRMGAFSLNREQPDRRSIDYAMQVIADADRPLVIFPEGVTYRTNDLVKPLLDGTTFIARGAARRAAKLGRSVVMIPVGLKYLCVDPVEPWADRQLQRFETRFGWGTGHSPMSVLDRTRRVHAAWMSLIEAQYDCPAQDMDVHDRGERLMQCLLQRSESSLGMNADDGDTPAGRARAIRSHVAGRYFDAGEDERRLLRHHSRVADKVLELSAYPQHYIADEWVTDTRLVETIQRMQESIDGKADASMRLKVIIRFDHPIPVPATKAPRGETDPLMIQLDQRLRAMIEQMQTMARPLSG